MNQVFWLKLILLQNHHLEIQLLFGKICLALKRAVCVIETCKSLFRHRHVCLVRIIIAGRSVVARLHWVQMKFVHQGGAPCCVLVEVVAYTLQYHQSQAETVAEGTLLYRGWPIIAGLCVIHTFVEQHHLVAGLAKLAVKILDLDSNALRIVGSHGDAMSLIRWRNLEWGRCSYHSIL